MGGCRVAAEVLPELADGAALRSALDPPPSFPRCEVLDLRGSSPRAVAVITQQPAPLFVVLFLLS